MNAPEVKLLLTYVNRLLAEVSDETARQRLMELRAGLEYRQNTGRWNPEEGDAWRRFTLNADANRRR